MTYILTVYKGRPAILDTKACVYYTGALKSLKQKIKQLNSNERETNETK